MQPNQILDLAKSGKPADRERLLTALVELCGAEARGGERTDPQVQSLMTSVFMSLVADAEHQIRQSLAHKLADVNWAPNALVNILALDEIEIARPIISQSPVLQDDDLVRIIALATLDHQVAIAGRPAIGGPVVTRLLKTHDPHVLTALAGNDTALIDEDGMAALLEASRKIASLRSPLVRHPRMTPDMAQELYLWVGQSLRSAIVGRFRVDPEALDKAIAEAVNDAHDGEKPPTKLAPVVRASEDQIEMETRLVEKLHISGQLRPGFLVKALRDQRLSLFVTGLAHRIDVDRATIQRAIDSDQPQLLALACVSAGIDRGAYDTILRLVRDLNGGRPSGNGSAGRQALAAFNVQDPSKARLVLRQVSAG